jgi:aspartate ammonia-lyase
MRKEKDLLGVLEIDDEVNYGVHTKRAADNFRVKYKKVNIEIIRAYAVVKKACAAANFKTGRLCEAKYEAISAACDDVIAGKYDEDFVLPAIQGGAGTSINMNMNEVIANAGLLYMGHVKGEYDKLHPLEDVNMSQSTNDSFPTAIKIAIIKILRELTDAVMDLQTALQKKESEFADVFKLGRTQLKDAVPITLGQEFGAYAEAISRDRWRLYKCEERIRQINMGGTAIGTGVGASQKYRFAVTEELRNLTGYGLARAENLIDATQNLDAYVEVAAIVKTLAVNLNKISSDLRLMDSGPVSGFSEIILPPLQAGSTIMPGKVNPVGPEFIKQIYYKVIGNDLALTIAAADGNFELNPMLPLVADCILENLEILRDGVKFFSEKVITGIQANRERCREYIEKSWSLASLFIEKLGYEKLTEILKESFKTGRDYKEIIIEKGLLDKETMSQIIRNNTESI